jgi:hypothetical protein
LDHPEGNSDPATARLHLSARREQGLRKPIVPAQADTWDAEEGGRAMSARDKAIETAMQRAVCTTQDLTHRVPVLLSELAAAGLAVLPVEPTKAMVDAGYEARLCAWPIEDIYRAMLAAAKEDRDDA